MARFRTDLDDRGGVSSGPRHTVDHVAPAVEHEVVAVRGTLERGRFLEQPDHVGQDRQSSGGFRRRKLPRRRPRAPALQQEKPASCFLGQESECSPSSRFATLASRRSSSQSPATDSPLVLADGGDDLQDVVGLRQDRLFEVRVIRHMAIECAHPLDGASRYSKSSSAMRAATSAPNPHVNWSS